MNQLTDFSEQKTMSSREIAQITGKRHYYVMNEVKKLTDDKTLDMLSYLYKCPAKVIKDRYINELGTEYIEYIMTYAVSAEVFLKFGSFTERAILVRKSNCMVNIDNYIDELRRSGRKYKNKQAERKEAEFYKKHILKIFDEKEVIREFQVLNGKYRIDFYIPKENLAIEFDEKHHDYRMESDYERQKEIEAHLKCEFVRISERQLKLKNIKL